VALTFGQAHVFYPEATENRCTAALLIEVDPVELVRKPGGPSGEGGLLDQYVNDRPYVSSSFTSVALARAFGTALGGRTKNRQELADAELPLEVRIAVIPSRDGEAFVRRLFEPLGYETTATRHPLDEKFPEWGDSRYWSVTLTTKKRLQDVLQHLYVLLPVLDDEKHYWVGKDEVEKLLRRGQGWLSTHPAREEITRRYLKYQHRLMREAMARLIDEDNDPDEVAEARAAERLRLNSLPPRKRERIKLLQGSLMYRDMRLGGYDAAAVVEVVEHLDPPRLAAFERVLFARAKPSTIVMTTPNREYNIKFETMPAGSFRHRDHRFEWTRQEFQSWTKQVALQHGYAVSFLPVGDADAVLGAPTQMAIFRLSTG